ncbi:MAG: hypothetical protein ABSE62_04060 [Chthoniobacteraceae bacterium]|jgi:hypothetical protein
MPTNDSRSLIRTTKSAVVHKVIDITPDAGGASKKVTASQLLAIADRHRGALLALAAVLFGGAIALMAIHGAARSTASATPAHPATPVQAIAAPKPAPDRPILVELNLPTAVQQDLVQCLWRGNGKDRLVLDAANITDKPLRLHLGAGQILASDDSTVVVLISQTLDFAPRAVLHQEIPTVATSSANRVVGAEYHLSAGSLPDLDKLFAYVASHPEATPGAIQTAALILTENLPLSAFAKFNELSAGMDTVHESDDFKADTIDILRALTIIKDLGIDRPLAVTIDPQLEVEAMIDPNAHGLALSYYAINDEWAYWKNQLLAGEPSTRHYALYGIARYYPQVALQMLPMWARQQSLSPVYRLSAVEALAETSRPDAIPILRQLESEFGATSDLGRAAHIGANYLDAEFAHSPAVDVTFGSAAHKPSALASAGN